MCLTCFSLTPFRCHFLRGQYKVRQKKDDQSTSHWFTMDLLSLCIHDGFIPMCAKCVQLNLLIFFYSHSHRIVFTIFCCLLYSCVLHQKGFRFFLSAFFFKFPTEHIQLMVSHQITRQHLVQFGRQKKISYYAYNLIQCNGERLISIEFTW